MTELTLQAKTAQTVTFSPRLQRAVQLLQMSSHDFRRTLLDAAHSNPFLELDEPEPDTESDTTTGAKDADNPMWTVEYDAFESRHSGSGTDALEAFESVAIPRSLQSHLHSQIGVLRLDPTTRALADAVVEGLDDDGYLRVSLEDLQVVCSSAGAVTLADMERALAVVQSCEPAGIGARSVRECLELQLAATPACSVRDLAIRILIEQLDLLTTRRTKRLANSLGATLSATCVAIELIRSLDPHPGSQCSDSVARAITADVTVKKSRGIWVTKLNASALPRVRLNTLYSELVNRQATSVSSELSSSLEAAKWTVSNLAQRTATILEVARAIVRKQTLFFEFGPLAMKPLGLREVADLVGVHPSTVSRAVHDKYMQTPHGVFELRRFFSRGMEHASGSASAPTALRGLVYELITAEAPAEPISDAALALRLSQQGFRIARRTVTKYRQQLGIQSVEQRRASWVDKCISATPQPPGLNS